MLAPHATSGGNTGASSFGGTPDQIVSPARRLVIPTRERSEPGGIALRPPLWILSSDASGCPTSPAFGRSGDFPLKINESSCRPEFPFRNAPPPKQKISVGLSAATHKLRVKHSPFPNRWRGPRAPPFSFCIFSAARATPSTCHPEAPFFGAEGSLQPAGSADAAGESIGPSAAKNAGLRMTTQNRSRRLLRGKMSSFRALVKAVQRLTEIHGHYGQLSNSENNGKLAGRNASPTSQPPLLSTTYRRIILPATFKP